jgi:hypothetical protein
MDLVMEVVRDEKGEDGEVVEVIDRWDTTG